MLLEPRLIRFQRLHARSLLIGPLLGTAGLPVFIAFGGFKSADVAIFCLFYFLSIAGITVGFHRLFAHRAFAATKGLRFLLGALGSMAAQGTLTYWVANHRRHHSDSDGPLDPHSPHVSGRGGPGRARGFVHAQYGWTLAPEITNTMLFARDLLADPVARRINRTYFVWVTAGLLLPGLIGWGLGGTGRDALAGFLWGGPVRLLAAFHLTSLVNSAGHLWGRRAHDTGECSRNLWWLALPTLGEGWHNNHHAFPRSARFGHRWWQIDPGGDLIALFRRCGLARDVILPASHYARRGRSAEQQPEQGERQDHAVGAV